MGTDRETRNIILTGFMATGKSTVGQLLATTLGYEFVDTDDLIQARQGLSIPEIFLKLGEAEFRRMEADFAQELASRANLVISTGGRLMLDQVNAAALSERGQVFCLVATPDEILARIMNDSNRRPLLDGPNPGERIVELLVGRATGYDRFRQVVTTGKNPEEVTREIIAILNLD
jgi:shikimate kinase